jgi:putative ABC transport system permease protein
MDLRRIGEYVQLALTALRLNKLRSALTALGIIIGVASVIVMEAIGAGAAVALQQQVAALGTNVINVLTGSMRVGGRQLGSGGALPLSEQDLRAIRDSVPGVVAISGQLNGSVTAVHGAANWSTQVSGVHAEYFDVRPWPLDSGRYFTAAEVTAGARVALIGSSVRRELFADDEDPLGNVLRVNNVPLEIIGTLSTRGQAGGSDPDDVIVVPLTTARSRLVGRGAVTVPDTVGNIAVRIADGYDIGAAQQSIGAVLRRQRRIAPGTEDNFTIRNFAQLLQARNDQQRTLGYLLATTAAMSLVVGGIGIMNIMLVSVTERTREIGLRMAVGARGRDVMAQFLTEAVLLCLLGGLIGLLLGAAVTGLIAWLAGWTVSIGGGTVAVAILAAAAVGVIFGFVPARRAARLDPIEALRYE